MAVQDGAAHDLGALGLHRLTHPDPFFAAVTFKRVVVERRRTVEIILKPFRPLAICLFRIVNQHKLMVHIAEAHESQADGDAFDLIGVMTLSQFEAKDRPIEVDRPVRVGDLNRDMLHSFQTDHFTYPFVKPDPAIHAYAIVKLDRRATSLLWYICLPRGVGSLATSLDTSVVIGRCVERFRELGLTVRQSNKFNEIDDLIEQIGKPYLTPQLSPNWHEFTEENAFWLIAEDPDGGPVGVMGVRLDQLGGEVLADYWRRQLTRLHGEQKKSPIDEKHFPPVARRISGNVVYFGDLFVKPNGRGLPRFPLRAFSVMAYSLALLQWRVNWFYAFATDKHMKQGVQSQYMMVRSYPFVHYWDEPRPQRTDTDWMMCMDREDANYMIETALERADFF